MGTQNNFDANYLESLPEKDSRLIAKREALLGPLYQLLYKNPIRVVDSKGVHLIDAYGKHFLDCYNNVSSVGHCNQRVVDAVANQMGILNTNTRYITEGILDYSEKLLATFAPELGNVMYTCTASEAIDLAMRTAKCATGGTGFIVSANAYHGFTQAAESISPSMTKGVPLDANARMVAPPDTYHTPPGADIGKIFTENVQAAIDDMKKSGIKLAGLILDPVFTSDGLYFGPPGFLKGAVKCVHENGGLFIADEVQSGFGRIGDYLWGHQYHDLVPDLVVMGKAMGNGLPIAAMVAKPHLLQKFGSNFHYVNTFGGNPVCVAAANAVLDEIQENKVLDNCQEIGSYLLGSFRKMASKYDCIGDVRGLGMIFGIEFVKNRTTKEPNPEIADKLVTELRERLILINTTGIHGNILKIRPILIFSKENADYFLAQFEAAMDKLV